MHHLRLGLLLEMTTWTWTATWIWWLLLVCGSAKFTLKGFNGTIEGLCTQPARNGQLRRTVCCEGYTKRYQKHKAVCTPICSKPCQNSQCTAPEHCSCRRGYKPDPSSKYSCLPICSKECSNGKCIKPETCSCHDGYRRHTSNTYMCVPSCEKICKNGHCREKRSTDYHNAETMCSKDCINGICTAPETCVCHEGFKKLENSKYVCQPHCSKECHNGYCSAPEKCACNSGFLMNGNDLFTCNPVCTEGCVNGNCTSPDRCTCWSGFKAVNAFVCEAICTHGCVNGKCVSLEHCECDKGFVRSKDNPYRCEPSCDPQCVNSVCSSPNQCECLAGYEMMDYGRRHVCNPVCSQGCRKGRCVRPEVCECLKGYVPYDSPSNCVPSCSFCLNGVCVAAEFCQCWKGYKHPPDTKSTCVPVCREECVNGVCTGPETCTCLWGFDRTDDAKICSKSNSDQTDCSFLLNLKPRVLHENGTDQTSLSLENECVIFDLLVLKKYSAISLDCSCNNGTLEADNNYLNLGCLASSQLFESKEFSIKVKEQTFTSVVPTTSSYEANNHTNWNNTSGYCSLTNRTFLVKISVSFLKFIKEEKITKDYFDRVRRNTGQKCNCFNWDSRKLTLNDSLQLQLDNCSCESELDKTKSANMNQSRSPWSILLTITFIAVLSGTIGLILVVYIRKY